MPSKIFWAYVKMMSVIEARRSIGGVNQMSYAFGSMTKEDSAGFRFRMSQMATLQSGRRDSTAAVRPRSPMELAALAGSGTAVVMVPGPKTKAAAVSNSTPLAAQEKEEETPLQKLERENEKAFEKVTEELDALESQ